MKNWKTFILGVVGLVLCLVFCVRMMAVSQAKDYINQKYGDIINLDNIAINSITTKVGYPHIIDKAWPVFFEYDGIDFQVDILSKSDSFAEKYIEKEYIQQFLSEYKGNKIRLIDIPHIQIQQGLSDQMTLDNLFYLEVTFDHTVDTIESFANEVEEILLVLSRTGLSNCDTLEAFANIEDKTMHIRISPKDAITAKDITEKIVEFPTSD